MMVRVGAVDVRRLAERVHQIVAARHGARKSAADADVILARGALAETRVKSHHLQNLDGFKAELCGNPVHRFITDEAKVMLHQMQKRQHGAAFRNGIMRDRLVHAFLQLGWNFKGHCVRVSDQSLRVYSAVTLSHDEIQTAKHGRNIADHVSGKKV